MDKSKIVATAKNNTLIEEMATQGIPFEELFKVIDSRGFSPVHIVTENGFLPQFLRQLDEYNIPAEKKWFLTNFTSSQGGTLGRTILHLAAEKRQVPELMEWLEKNIQPLVLDDLTVTSNAGAPVLGVLIGHQHLPAVMSAFYERGTPITFEMLETVKSAYGQSMIEFAASRGALSSIIQEWHREGQNVKFTDIEPYIDRINRATCPEELAILESAGFWNKLNNRKRELRGIDPDGVLELLYNRKFEEWQARLKSPSTFPEQ